MTDPCKRSLRGRFPTCPAGSWTSCCCRLCGGWHRV